MNFFNTIAGTMEELLPCPECGELPKIHADMYDDHARCPSDHFRAGGFYDGATQWCLSRWNFEHRTGALERLQVGDGREGSGDGS